MTNWIKCSDRMPEVGVEVLLVGRHRVTSLGYLVLWDNKCSWSDDGLSSSEGIGFYTHWMPLPEPPSEDE